MQDLDKQSFIFTEINILYYKIYSDISLDAFERLEFYKQIEKLQKEYKNY